MSKTRCLVPQYEVDGPDYGVLDLSYFALHSFVKHVDGINYLEPQLNYYPNCCRILLRQHEAKIPHKFPYSSDVLFCRMGMTEGHVMRLAKILHLTARSSEPEKVKKETNTSRIILP